MTISPSASRVGVPNCTAVTGSPQVRPTLFNGPICSLKVMLSSVGEASIVLSGAGAAAVTVASACAVGAHSEPTNPMTVSGRSQPRAGRANGRFFMSSQQR